MSLNGFPYKIITIKGASLQGAFPSFDLPYPDCHVNHSLA